MAPGGRDPTDLLVGVNTVLVGAHAASLLYRGASGVDTTFPAMMEWWLLVAGFVGLILMADLATRGKRYAVVAGGTVFGVVAVSLVFALARGGSDVVGTFVMLGLALLGPVATLVSLVASRGWTAATAVAAGSLSASIVVLTPQTWVAEGGSSGQFALLRSMSWTRVPGGVLLLASALGMGWSLRSPGARLPRVTITCVPFPLTWVAATVFLVLSWAFGGVFIVIPFWWLSLVLYAAPPLLDVIRRPGRAGVVTAVLLAGLLPISCRAWRSSDGGSSGWVQVHGTLLEVGTRGPLWHGGGWTETLDVACPWWMVVAGAAWAITLAAAAGWRRKGASPSGILAWTWLWRGQWRGPVFAGCVAASCVLVALIFTDLNPSGGAILPLVFLYVVPLMIAPSAVLGLLMAYGAAHWPPTRRAWPLWTIGAYAVGVVGAMMTSGVQMIMRILFALHWPAWLAGKFLCAVGAPCPPL